MSESNQQSRIIFREAKSVDELRALLKLRYQVYRESRLAGVLSYGSAESAQIDIDQFDPYSHHFGLFAESQGVETGIGYLRIATQHPQAQNSPITELIQKMGAPVVKHPDCIYPMQTHDGFAEVTQFLSSVTQDGSRMVEQSRLSIAPESRSIRISVFLLECSIAWWLRGRHELAWLCCAESQERAYQRYGFRPIHGASEFFLESLAAVRMYLQPEFIPSYRRDRLDVMAQELDTGGFITLPSRKSARDATETTVIEKAQIQTAKVA